MGKSSAREWFSGMFQRVGPFEISGKHLKPQLYVTFVSWERHCCDPCSSQWTIRILNKGWYTVGYIPMGHCKHVFPCLHVCWHIFPLLLKFISPYVIFVLVVDTNPSSYSCWFALWRKYMEVSCPFGCCITLSNSPHCWVFPFGRAKSHQFHFDWSTMPSDWSTQYSTCWIQGLCTFWTNLNYKIHQAQSSTIFGVVLPVLTIIHRREGTYIKYYKMYFPRVPHTWQIPVGPNRK